MTHEAAPERRRPRAPGDPAADADLPRRRGPPPPSGEWLIAGPDDDLVRPASDEESDPGQPRPAPRPAIVPPPATAPAAGAPRPASAPAAAAAPDPFANDPFAQDPFAGITPAAAPAPPAGAVDPFADIAPAAPPRISARPRPAPAPAAADPFADDPFTVGGDDRPAASPAPAAGPAAVAEAPAARPLLPPPRALRLSESDSVSSGGSRTGPPVPPRRRSAAPLIIGVSVSALVVVPGIVWLELDRRHSERQRSDFLATYEGLSPEEALARADALPDAARADPRVADVVAALRERVRRAAARARAEEVLAGLAAAATVQERQALCDRAIVIDDSCAAAYLERARLRLRAPGVAPDEARRAALVDLGLAIEKDPADPLPRYVRACVQLAGNERERDDARRELKEVAELDALGGLGSMARGRLEMVLGNPEAARRALDAAVERRPEDPDPLMLRAEVWLLLDDGVAALRDASAAIRLDPRSAAALALRAEARWSSQGDLVGARKDLEEALELDADLPRALALRADLRLSSAGDAAPAGLDEALRDADLALRQDPGLGRAHLVRAEVAAVRGQAEAAIGHATRAIEAAPGLLRAYLLRGRLRASRGEHPAALDDYGQALRLDPDNLEALTRRAGALVREKRYDAARADLDRVLSRRDVPEAFLYRGVATLRANQGIARYTQAALDDLSRAIQLAPRQPDAYFHRAEAYFGLEQFEACLEDLDRAEGLVLGGAPATSFARHELAYLRGHCRFQRRQWQEAVAAYTRYLELAPPGDPGLSLARRRLQQCRDALDGRPGEW